MLRLLSLLPKKERVGVALVGQVSARGSRSERVHQERGVDERKKSTKGLSVSLLSRLDD